MLGTVCVFSITFFFRKSIKVLSLNKINSKEEEIKYEQLYELAHLGYFNQEIEKKFNYIL